LYPHHLAVVDTCMKACAGEYPADDFSLFDLPRFWRGGGASWLIPIISRSSVAAILSA
jgi:hypothetical protein